VELSANQAMALWHRVLVAALNRELPDLTARQFALLLHVYLAQPPHTVRGLAVQLKMSKPAVTRALDRLSALGFVKRQTDQTDRRSILVKRTVAGAVFLRDFADLAGEQAAVV
jgi:DNA-binding MarR family transcriptional regulator